MKRLVSISALNKRFSIALGLLAAIMVVCTSLLRFQLEVNDGSTMGYESAQLELAKEGKADPTDNSEKEPYTVCTIQAVSQGVQLHVVYDPVIWELVEIELPELKVVIPGKVYTASWEYFKILFSDIISPNAP